MEIQKQKVLENYSFRRLSPFIKWAGGKEAELQHILPNIPDEYNRYFEPFVGAGAVYFSMDSDEKYINDKSTELIQLYKFVKENNENFFSYIQIIYEGFSKSAIIIDRYKQLLINIYNDFRNCNIGEDELVLWISDFVDLNIHEVIEQWNKILMVNKNNYLSELNRNFVSKIIRMKKIEAQKKSLNEKDIISNIESAVKSAYYMYIRHLYNNSDSYSLGLEFSSAIFYFIREYCYASMFRYNSCGEFNVPYGGISYNNKNFKRKIDYISSIELNNFLQNTYISNLDFEEFLDKFAPSEDDFIFLDPPYDSDFSTYTQNSFGKKEQERLADYLINKCRAKFMLVIKNTDFIFSLYSEKGLNIISFDKKYLVSFQNRNTKKAKHLMITNY
ncbi:MAG: DNA adenine methylase [Eubacteriales bacterium]